MSLSYRPEIDGLRAIAVGAVVLYHAGLPGIGGGYAGVDVFFVLSGYLIGAILMDGMAQGRFSLLHFYERRARRLLPALAVVVLVTTLLSAALMRSGPFEDYAESLFATALFAANLYFLRKEDYFGPAAEEMPLLHMWSLAVEEQFYIVFPLLLWALWRWRHAALWPVLAGLSALSLLAAMVATQIAPQANFYLPTGRAWELLAGVAVAWHLHRHPRGYRPWAAWAGLFLIAGSLVLIDANRPWPGAWTIPVVTGTVLVLLYADPLRGAGRLLSAAPLVGLGLISYSVYLWHWPLMALARTAWASPPALWVMLALAALSVLSGWASWRFVERPFRHGRAPRMAVTAAAMVLLFAAGSGLALRGAADNIGALQRTAMGSEARVRLAAIEATAERYPHRAAPCRFRTYAPDAGTDAAFDTCRDRHGPAVLVVGDSHAETLFDVLARESDVPFLVGFAKPGCWPHARITGRPLWDECHTDAVRDFVARRGDDIALILYNQASHPVFEAARHATGPDGFHPELVVDIATWLADLDRHAPVLALGPTPATNVHAGRLTPWLPLAAQIAVQYDPRTAQAGAVMDTEMARATAQAGVAFLSLRPALAAFALPDALLHQGHLTFRDEDHWSAAGERLFGPAVMAALRDSPFAARFGDRRMVGVQ